MEVVRQGMLRPMDAGEVSVFTEADAVSSSQKGLPDPSPQPVEVGPNTWAFYLS